MNTRSPWHTLVAFLILSVWLSGPAAAQATAPAVTLTSPAAPQSETEGSTITLAGNAAGTANWRSVGWVNQFGQRGAGTLAATSALTGAQAWNAPNIPLRLGVNLITVTLVDATNHSASVHVAVNRKVAPGTRPPPGLPIGTGSWQNRPIVYQLWHGQAVVEGDIILKTSSFTPPTVSRDAAVTREIVRPDGLGISYTSQLWPSVTGVHQVPYIVTTYNGTSCTGTGSNANLTAALTAFNQTFAGVIKFVPASGQANYVNICVDGAIATEGYSDVGMVGGEQTLECGSACTDATWLHEMGHTVGLLHEHQRPDRANFITLNLANADLPNVPGNFTLYLYDYQTLGLYDYASVMHYAAFDFSKAGLPVLESIPAGIPLSNNTGYSAGDIDTIERLYGATPSNVTVTTNPVGLKFIVDGTTYTGTQTFSFALNSTHTLSLPADPQYTNPADGSTYAFGGWNDQGARSHTITIQPGSNSLTSPATSPAVTMYQASFIRLQPFAFMSPAATPSGSGTISVSPSPTSEYGGSFFPDRTLVELTLSATAGYNLYDWRNLPFPPSDNPHSFYIQAPTPSAQAVLAPASSPVTLVGASITGPHTWNPGLAAYVDNAFTLLPSGFSAFNNYNPTWTPGSPHTVSMVYETSTLQEQSPVTLNVYYDWNDWSDGGAISHGITQPTTGSQTVSASFTPDYASYTVPAPGTGAGSNCAGSVTTSPAGTPYSDDIFDFYEDGTSVQSTATPNATFPNLVFTGWTGSLSGTTNPLTTTVDDQFVPTATFNFTAAPLTITSLSPSTAVASATAPLDVTINGSGFTPSTGTTYVYWNNSYRPYTYVSPTQLTLHLSAGDLANPGGQDVLVGNYESVTQPSSATCGVVAETSFTVTSTPPPADTSAATYTGLDTTTEGTWTGHYGSNGYLIANGTTNAPSYAAVSLTGDTPYTWTTSTTDPRALQTSSGASTRIASADYSNTSFTINVNLTDGNAHRVALYLLDWSTTGRSETITIVDYATNAVLSTESFSGFHNGEYAIWTLKGHVLIQVKCTGGDNAVVSGIFFDGLSTSSAKYAGLDSATEGTWTGKYGADGYLIANDATRPPTYATVGLTGDTPYTWTTSTTDPRALQTASGASTRIASAYYSNTSFTISVNLTDGNPHRVALYLLDWSTTGRSESISIVDAVTNTVLDTESYASFHNGVYASWTIQGNVLIKVTCTGGDNAVVSGVFFDPLPASSATYTGLDTTTEGTWTGHYGTNGFIIANGTVSPPAFATVSLTGDTPYTWTTSTTDPRALQTASGSTTRIASAYYSNTSFSINLNLTDGNPHAIALYLLDWSTTTRAETITILDAVSNAVLSTESYSSLHNGEWAKWTIQGHVIIQVTRTAGDNGVVSGIFF